MQTEQADGRRIAIIDARRMSAEQRKELLGWWFNDHLHCIDGVAHSWKSHRWLPELHAWIWEPCEKCGSGRLTQTTGNYLQWNALKTSYVALVIDDDFDQVLQKLYLCSADYGCHEIES